MSKELRAMNKRFKGMALKAKTLKVYMNNADIVQKFI
jgi:hypothetical protein